MPISVILLDLVILAGIWLYVSYYKTSKSQKRMNEDFLEKENAANFARRKEIDAEVYYLPDLSRLPFKEYESTDQNKNITRRIEEVRNRSSKQMIRFDSDISNTDLKMRYGLSNLDFIAGCEENYRKFINSLNEWAWALMDLEMYADASIVLEEAIKMGSDMSRSYKLLADSYRKTDDQKSLDELLSAVESRKYKFSNDTIMENVIQYLKNPEV